MAVPQQPVPVAIEQRWRPSRPTAFLGVTLAAVLVWFAGEALLLLFAAILAAILLRSLADGLAARTFLSGSVALAVVILALLAVAAGFAALVAPSVAAQIDELQDRLPEVLESLRTTAEGFGWGVSLINAPLAQLEQSAGQFAEGAVNVIKTTVGGLTSLFFLGLLGLYLAAESDRYTAGLAALFPQDLERKVESVLSELAHSLRWWLVGQGVSMSVLGVVAFIGFKVFGIPLALLLALLTATLTFVPNVGPALAAIPPLLLALTQGGWTALYLAIFLLAMQTSEGSFLTPMVQRQAAHLPPALLLGIQVLALALGGIWGLVLAAPMTVAGMVLVRRIYLEGVLHKTQNG